MPKRPTKELRGIILAFDGVVVRSRSAILHCLERAMAQLGAPFDRAHVTYGCSFADAIAALLAQQGRPVFSQDVQTAAARCTREYANLLRGQRAALVPGITNVLASFRPTRGAYDTLRATLRVAIVSPYPCGLERIVASLGLEPYCDLVLDPTDAPEDAPPEYVFSAAVAALSIPANACVGVDVAPAGIQAIAAAGCFPVGIRTPLASSDALGYAGAEMILAGTEHLQQQVLETALSAWYSQDGGYGPKRRKRRSGLEARDEIR